jgi:hypothetical protein
MDASRSQQTAEDGNRPSKQSKKVDELGKAERATGIEPA